MINKVSFTGRETMLTKGMEKVANRAAEYVSPSKIYSKAEMADAKILLEQARFASSESTMADAIASYKAAHQPIYSATTPKTATTVDVEHIDLFA